MFSSDGKWLLTASTDNTAEIWGIADAEPHLILSHTSGVRTAAFRPGDAYVVTGSEDGAVRLWRITTPDLIDYLSKSNTACLTSPERVRYLGEPEKKAASAYAACEIAHKRPAPKVPATPTR